jgi:hypothetical protein
MIPGGGRSCSQDYCIHSGWNPGLDLTFSVLLKCYTESLPLRAKAKLFDSFTAEAGEDSNAWSQCLHQLQHKG